MKAPLSIPKPLSGPIARSTVRTTGVLAIRLLVQAGTLLVLARLLGPAQFGAFASLSALAVFLGALGTFGTHLTLMRDLSRDAGQRATVLPTTLGTSAACGGALFLVYLVLSFVLLGALSIGPLPIICIGIAELLLQPLLLVSSVERLATGETARSQMLMLFPLLLRMLIAACILFVDTDNPLGLYAIGHLAATIIALAVSVALLTKPWPMPHQWRLLHKDGWKDSSGFALLAFTASGPSELDKMLAARLLPLDMAGIYSAASRITGALVIPVSSLMLSALPRLFRASSSNGHHESTLLYAILGSCMAYGFVAAAAIWLVAPLIEWPFGRSFIGMADTIRWFSFAVPSLCLRLAAANVLMSMGHPWIRFGVEASLLTLMAASAFALTSNGIHQGIVIAVIGSETAMALVAWGWILSHRNSDISVQR